MEANASPFSNGREYVARYSVLFARRLRSSAVGCGRMRRRMNPMVNSLGPKLL